MRISPGRSDPARAAWGEQVRGDLLLAELGVGQAPGRRRPVRGGDQVQLQPQYQRECAAQYP